MRNTSRILMSSFLVIQMLFSFITGSNLQMAKVANAAVGDGPLNTNSTTELNVAKYEGVEQSIANYLCVPDESDLGGALYTCITKLYRFGIAFGAIALVFFFVFAGYLYMTGGESSKGKGKEIFTTALTGMALILCSYVLLYFINPDLIKIKTIQTPIFTAANLPKCEEVGLGVNCVLPDGQVSVGGSTGGGGSVGTNSGCQQCTGGTGSISALSGTCMGANAEVASFVAATESSCGKNMISGVDICADGSPASFGLFQINISAHEVDGKACPNAFTSTYTASNHSCRVKDQPLYNACKAAALDIGKNVTRACTILASKKAKGDKYWYPTWGGASCLHKTNKDLIK